MLSIAAALLALSTPPRGMYRKGLRFGDQPVFRELAVGGGCISSGPKTFDCQFARFGPRAPFSGSIVHANPPEADGPLDNSDIEGAIAVVQRGKCSLEAKMRHCAAVGAAGVVLINNEDERFVAAPDPPSEPPTVSSPQIPFVVIASSDGALLSSDAVVTPLPLESGMPLFPLKRVLLPGERVPLQLGDAEKASLLEHLGASNLVAVVLCSDDAALATVCTEATIEVSGPMATLSGLRTRGVRSLLRESTPDEVGLMLTEELDDGGPDAAAEAEVEVDAMCASLNVDLSSVSPRPDPSRLSFTLCQLIALTPPQAQAALELQTPARLRALNDQLLKNPTRGVELLQQAMQQDLADEEPPVGVPAKPPPPPAPPPPAPPPPSPPPPPPPTSPPARRSSPRMSAGGASLSDRIFEPRLVNPAAAQRTKVVRVPGFADDATIAAIHDAAAAVRDAAGVVTRSNGLEEGSWRTVFFNHRLGELLPSLRADLLAAAHAADNEQGWGVLEERRALSIRCAEYHTVQTSGGLPMQKHYDAGSLITMDIMLSATDQFEGGSFGTLEADGPGGRPWMRPQPFERGDLLVFLAHKYHTVQPVTSGTRQVLVAELWEGLERRCARRCNVPWGPCTCALSPSELYYNREARIDFADVPFSYRDPLFVKMAWGKLRQMQGK